MDAITRALVDLALQEDLGTGDVTSALLPPTLRGAAQLVAKGPLVVSGLEVFAHVFARISPAIRVAPQVEEGAAVEKGAVVAAVEGPMARILEGERTALNFVQRLSGVASLTRRCVEALGDTKTRLVDTRKTTPGFRVLEKAAVRHGGGSNHRFGLFDGVLVKDNHVDAQGGIRPALEAARRVAHHLVKIECEVRSLAELDEALDAGADVVLLDNMDDDTIRAAVARARAHPRPVLLEASGNVSLERLPTLGALGVDLVSMGALTHSAPAADLSLVHRGAS